MMVFNLCPICSSAGAEWFTRNNRTLNWCKDCTTAWIPQGVCTNENGESIYEDKNSIFLKEGNKSYYLDGLQEINFQEKLTLVGKYIQQHFRLVDVGANMGQFCSVAASQYDIVGLEISPQAVAIGQQNFYSKLYVGSVYDSNYLSSLAPNAITAWDVIEHLDQPSVAIASIANALPVGGYLFLSTPDIGSIVAKMMGKQWHYIDVEQHVTLFSRDSLNKLLKQFGFQIIEIIKIGHSYQLTYILDRLSFLYTNNKIRLNKYCPSFLKNKVIRLCLGDVVGIVAIKN